MGNVRLYGATSGYTELAPPAVAGDNVLTLPSGVGTLAKAEGGMKCLANVTITATQNTSVNDVFSVDFPFYRVLYSFIGSGAGGPSLRLRVAGADNSAAEYDRQSVSGGGTTATGGALTASSTFSLAPVAGNRTIHFGSFDLLRPFEAVPTLFIADTYEGNADNAAPYTSLTMGRHRASSSFTGFSFLGGTGITQTGVLSVYGYGKV